MARALQCTRQMSTQLPSILPQLQSQTAKNQCTIFFYGLYSLSIVLIPGCQIFPAHYSESLNKLPFTAFCSESVTK